jgi:hypothetical protein
MDSRTRTVWSLPTAIINLGMSLSDELGRLRRAYPLLSVTSSILVPPLQIQECLNVATRGIESACGGSQASTGQNSCSIRVFCAASGSARFLALQLARRSIPQATTLTVAMMLVVASLKACR